MKKNLNFKRVLIAKTTHLGDFVISLPMATMIKRHYPDVKVIFLTHPRVVDVAKRCLDVDETYPEPESVEALTELLKSLQIDIFIQANTSKQLGLAAKLAEIPIRIGSLFRLYNWSLCNRLVAISRPYKGLNKRLLDLEYLKPLGIETNYEQLSSLNLKFSKKDPAELSTKIGLNYAKHRIILHPSLVTSQAHQWPLSAYASLIESFDPNNFQWIITGTLNEKTYLQPLLNIPTQQADVIDTVGKLSIDELVTLMSECNGLIAGSTGPLHLATALGLHSLGLYQSNPATHKRWAPIGLHATMLHSSTACRGDKEPEPCPCILAITPQTVKNIILPWFDYKD